MKDAVILTVSSRALVDACVELGLDTDAMLEAAGLDRATVYDADARISGGQVALLWREAHRRSGDPDLALHAAEALPAGAYKVIDFLAGSSTSVGAGLSRISRYFPLINSGVELPITVGPKQAFLGVTSSGSIPRAYAEYTLAAVFLRSRAAYAMPFPLERVELVHPRPEDTSEHERIFDCPVHFDAAQTRLCLTRSAWDTPVATGNAGLSVVLEEHAKLLLDALPRSSGEPVIVSQVREALLHELRGGNPALHHVARRLGMGERTIQRRLKDWGTSYAELLDKGRESVALVYLEQRDISLAEVGHLLGFAEQSSFSRAFKRWTGSTPRQSRQRMGPA